MATETSAKETETTASDVDRTEHDRDERAHRNDAFTGWVASSALRIGLVFVGFFLLLAALGQLSGIDILAVTAEVLGTETGQWLLVAVVAMAMIAIAVHGFTGRAD